MSTSLIVGYASIGDYMYRLDDHFYASVVEGDVEIARCPQNELWTTGLGPLAPYRDQITSVRVAYTKCPDLAFLRELPHVQDVRLHAPRIGSIGGLLYLPTLDR